MNYYKKEDGSTIATIGILDLPVITKEEFETKQSDANAKIEVYMQLKKNKLPLTELDVLSMLIPHQINMLDVSDNVALRMKGFYPTFENVIGREVKQGFKFTSDNKLWRTEQPDMIIQAHFIPGPGMESLYSEVCETHNGTLDDPIPYDGNMVLENGKYYVQDWVVYLCNRDTVNPVYNSLIDLVGLYVEKV